MKKLLAILAVLSLTACSKNVDFEVCNVSIWWEQMPLHYVAQSTITKEKTTINKEIALAYKKAWLLKQSNQQYTCPDFAEISIEE